MPDIRILRQETCPSLSGRSELTYEFGKEPLGKVILFRIADNSGSGHFHSAWIPMDEILAIHKGAKEPFSLGIFKRLYTGMSINNLGFLGAALMKEGLIVCEKRKYLKKDTKTFTANLNKLAKASPRKTPSNKSETKAKGAK